MFGWFCTQMNDFGDGSNLKTDLVLQDNCHRPDIVFEQSEHPLSVAFHKAISQELCMAIIERYPHALNK